MTALIIILCIVLMLPCIAAMCIAIPAAMDNTPGGDYSFAPVFKAAGCGVTVIAMVGIFGLSLAIYLAATHVEQPKPETFNEWFARHSDTCPDCGAGPDKAMCVEAFERMQDELKK